MGLSEIMGIDLEKAIEEKMEINEKRVYKNINDVTTRIDE